MAISTPKRKTLDLEDAETPAPKASKVRPKPEWQVIWKDKRLQQTVGVSLVVLSFYLLLASFSYLFTGTSDQSLLLGEGDESLREDAQDIENLAGWLGAWASHLLVYNTFGLGIFFLLPIPFSFGVRTLLQWYHVKLAPLVQFCVFWCFWISITLGWVVLVGQLDSDYTLLGGTVGFELASWGSDLLGWAVPILLVASALLHLIWFFGYLDFSGAKASQEGAEAEELLVVADDDKPVRRVRTRSTVVATQDDEEDTDSDTSHDTSEQETTTTPPDPFGTSSIPLQVNLPTSPAPEPATQAPKPAGLPTLNFNVVIPEGDKTIEPTDTLPLESITRVEQEARATEVENYDPTLELSTYQYPVVHLLKEGSSTRHEVDQRELEENKDTILQTLKNFKIEIQSISATVGPTVTLYEIVPEAGIKVNKIKNLEDDIALSLAALGIRIIAPMPGKGTIGIEVPNKKRETVYLRSVLTTEKFMRSTMDLPVVLGKTISNEVLVADLAKMPHLLMAGATGQGKSVGINILLTSLLYKKHPSQLKLVLVDPKKVELSVYSKIEHHFLAKLPGDDEAIITDTRKVVHTLNSLCELMDRRYDLLKEAGCRNLKEYNQKFVERRLNPNKGHAFMPYVVLVIDELADLMMTAGKEVEVPIARLAQLARAIGIHLVVATQRPSVNVITGIIKANFPARLSFRVTSKVDSRTILDAGGAEQLVGQGDMLLSQGSDIIRIQCPFVDTPEVENICEFIGEQRGYAHAYELPVAESMEEGDIPDLEPGEIDPLFAEAARLIVTNQTGSTSLIQRKLKLGYNRAGRLMDQLAAHGIVGPAQGSKPREVYYVDLMQLEDYLNNMNSSDGRRR